MIQRLEVSVVMEISGAGHRALRPPRSQETLDDEAPHQALARPWRRSIGSAVLTENSNSDVVLV